MRAIVLALAFVSSMVTGQEANPHSDAHKRNSTAKSADAPDTAGRTIIVVNQPAPQGQENSHPAKSPSYLRRLFSAENLPNIALVIAAAITALYVARQARETAKATSAVERNTRAFIEGQRPIISCNPHGHPLQDLTGTVPRMRLALSNHGPASAFHCRHESWIEYIPHEVGEGFAFDRTFTFSDAASHFVSDNPFSLYPDHDPVIINIPAGRDLSYAEKLAIQRGQLLVCVRLLLTFDDAFHPNRFSDFGFWVMYEGMGSL